MALPTTMVHEGAYDADAKADLVSTFIATSPTAQTKFLLELTQGLVTAKSGGNQTNGTLLTGQTAEVTTVAAAGDAVLLPPAQVGLELLVINHGANSMQVFGSGTDTIDDVATATGVAQMQNSLVIYSCPVAGKWYSEGLATGYGGSGLQTLSFTPAITAVTPGAQSTAIKLTTMVNRIGTAVNQGDGVALPPAKVGLEVIIINRGAQPIQVFGDNTAADTINGIATATGIAQGVGTAATYVCNVLGNWEVPLTSLFSSFPIALTTNGALNPHVSHNYMVTKAGILAMTLGAPTTVVDDGIQIQITSTTANQHTITATGLFVTGTASVNVATFPASAGGSITLQAFGAKWYLVDNVAVVMS